MANEATARKREVLQPFAERYPEFRRLLLERRARILSHESTRRRGIDEQLLTSPGDLGDASVVDEGTDYYLSLAANDRLELEEIAAALQRLQRGTFGICENCGIEVDSERLEKVPQARLCIDCQASRETRYSTSRGRPAPKL